MISTMREVRQWPGSPAAQFPAAGKLQWCTHSGGLLTVRVLTLLVLGLAAIAACNRSSDDTRPARNVRERDSVIGASRLPGATGVRGALRVSDSADARNARIDSAGQP